MNSVSYDLSQPASPLFTGSRATDTLLTFPVTWRPASVKWATDRKFSQEAVDAIEANLITFRRKRDAWRVMSFQITQESGVTK